MRLRERFQRMMYGRYGSDQLSMFCFVLYLVIWVVGLFIRVPQVRIGLNLFSYVIIFVYFFRFFSKNIYKRQQENLKFMAVFNRVKNYFNYLKLKVKERDGAKKIFRCPKCHQMIRVPKGRGKIAIRCPKCKFEFIRRS